MKTTVKVKPNIQVEIPREIAETLGIVTGDLLSCELKNKSIILIKHGQDETPFS